MAQDDDVTSNIKQTIEVNNCCEGAVTCTVGSTNTPDTPVDNNEEEPSGGEASISAVSTSYSSDDGSDRIVDASSDQTSDDSAIQMKRMLD